VETEQVFLIRAREQPRPITACFQREQRTLEHRSRLRCARGGPV